MKLMVINGSVRKNSVGEKMAEWIQEVLATNRDLQLDMVDLREVDLPFFNESTIPGANGGAYENPKGAAWAKRVGQADSYLFITPEYNHGPTAVLKNALDWVDAEWHFKPAGFVSYGGTAGGTRAVQQLKQNLIHLDIFPIHYNIHLRLWGGDVDENGRPQATYDNNLHKIVTDLKTLAARLSH